MLETVTREGCLGRLNERFRVEADSSTSGELELKLVEVKSLGENDGGRDPFSLLFRGPSEPALAQRIYKLDNDILGQMEVFLVPVGSDESGSMLYEAVFN